MSVLQLDACPFCSGPPLPIVVAPMDGGGWIGDERLAAATDGLYAEAYVFCHECGAEGPHADGWILDLEDRDALEAQGVQLWQRRDRRHRHLYDSGHREGLNLYPRQPCDRDPGDEHIEAALNPACECKRMLSFP